MSEVWGWLGIALGLVLFWLATDLSDYGYDSDSHGHQMASMVSFAVAVIVMARSVTALMPG